MPSSQLQLLRSRLGEIADVKSAIALLEWDQETYMPPKAGAARGQQLGTLSAIAHRLLTAQETGRLLNDLNAAGDLEGDDARLVEEALYDHNRAVKLPEPFVQRFAEESSAAYQTWVKSRETSDFPLFAPHLERLVSMLREKAQLLGYADSPYDALLEDYERGVTAAELGPLFGELAAKQSGLVARIMDKGVQPAAPWLDQDWDEKGQWDFTLCVLRDMGYDLDAGRQDKSVHPFTTSLDPSDVRVTTRIGARELFSGIAASIHEAGHALYEQGFCETDRRTPLANAPSLGIHESQSRMWENIIGHSLPFWKHYTPLLRQHFPERLDHVGPEEIYSAINRVEPSLIRVNADECTYNLHIILRFEIELALIEGDLSVSDVPEAWNAKVRLYLGIEVPDDRHGCLQDIHWSHGSMGYFPTYALGNLYAAQMFEKMLQDIPDLWSHVESGQFGVLLAWLRTHVHQHGRRKLAPDLIREITGADPSPAPFLSYLEQKYAALHGS